MPQPGDGSTMRCAHRVSSIGIASRSSGGRTCRYAARHVRTRISSIRRASPTVASLTSTCQRYAHAPMDFEHVLVVGAGQMGGGIAQVVAASGRRVSLHDPYPGAVEKGLAAIEKTLPRMKVEDPSE